jgi:hypothetical protein
MYYYFCEFTAFFDARTGKLGGRVGRFWHLMWVKPRARAFAAYLLMAVDIDSYR